MWRGMNVSFRDMLFLLVFAYLVIGAVALAHVRKKQEDVSGATPPGSVIVDIHWDDKIDADVDLWVQAPGDKPVGYSNKAGRYFNLLRDDLGKAQDVTDLNYEVAYSRGVPPGEYIANVHMYRGIGVTYPIEVKVVASVKPTPQDTAQQVVATTVQLKHENDQVTAFRFTLDNRGHLVAGSVNNVYRELRVATQ